MKKVLMSMAALAAMVAFVACGNNTKKAEEPAAEPVEQCCEGTECTKAEGECCEGETCCTEEQCAECPECPAEEAPAETPAE